VAVIAAILLFASLGPLLNLLSIQKMLLDLQDGNLTGFGSRFATYLTLFAIGYFLHRVIRSRLDSLKGRVANTVKKSQ
jgi:Na+-driven multidrug efflux pump